MARGWIAAVLVAITGAALLGFSHDSPHHKASGGHALLVILLALIAGGSYAGYTIATATLVRRGVPSRAAVGALFGLAATVLIPLLLITGANLFTTTRGIAVAGYLGFVPMGVGSKHELNPRGPEPRSSSRRPVVVNTPEGSIISDCSRAVGT